MGHGFCRYYPVKWTTQSASPSIAPTASPSMTPTTSRQERTPVTEQPPSPSPQSVSPTASPTVCSIFQKESTLHLVLRLRGGMQLLRVYCVDMIVCELIQVGAFRLDGLSAGQCAHWRIQTSDTTTILPPRAKSQLACSVSCWGRVGNLRWRGVHAGHTKDETQARMES